MVGAIAALLTVPMVMVISFLEDISPSFRRTFQLILIKKTLDYSVVPEEQGFEFDSYFKKKMWNIFFDYIFGYFKLLVLIKRKSINPINI